MVHAESEAVVQADSDALTLSQNDSSLFCRVFSMKAAQIHLERRIKGRPKARHFYLLKGSLQLHNNLHLSTAFISCILHIVICFIAMYCPFLVHAVLLT